MSIGTTTLNWVISTSESNPNGLVPQSVPVALTYSGDIGVGVLAGQADQVWSAIRTVVSGANDDLDIVGSLPITFGGPFTPARIVAIGIVNRAQVTGATLTVGNGSNPFYTGLFPAGTSTISVNAGGAFFWSSPIDPATPVASTGDILRVANPSAGPISYKIVLIGRSA